MQVQLQWNYACCFQENLTDAMMVCNNKNIHEKKRFDSIWKTKKKKNQYSEKTKQNALKIYQKKDTPTPFVLNF